jgi:diguanylate cyclase (GGDEF)-like protein
VNLPALSLPADAPLRRTRMATRIVLVFLGMLLLVQAAGFFVVRGGIERNARVSLAGELELGARVLQRLMAQNLERLSKGAALLASDYGFREAVSSGDAETIRSALENHGRRIGSTMAVLQDAQGGMAVAAGLPASSDLSAALARLPGSADTGAGSMLAVVDGRAYQFVRAPVRAPLIIGWVVMGFPLDTELLTDLENLSGVRAAVVVQREGAPTPDLALTSLTPAERDDLRATLAAGPVPTARHELVLAGEDMLASPVRLIDGGAGQPALQVLLLRSVSAVTGPYREQQWQLAGITLAGVLVFALGAWILARRVTTPLRSLARASARLGAGVYDQPVEHTQRLDEIGDLARAFETMQRDIAAHEAALKRQAWWDRLTGLPNRAQFVEAARAAIARAPAAQGDGPGLAVLLLNLARVKHVNDLLGYAHGDRLLQAVAQRLSAQGVREGDLIARAGGDEFAVLLHAPAAAQADAVAQRLLATLDTPLDLDDHRVDLGGAVGIACWPAHGDDPDLLLGRAELAMSVAKRRGVPVLAYAPSIDSASTQTLSLMGELRRAVERDELRLYLQPKVALATGEAVAAEALVRWEHPTRGMVPPMEFIPFAEQTGFVREITLWMFGQCCLHWHALHTLGLHRLSVNLSARDLMDPDLPAKLDALRERHRAPAAAFCLEITESTIMDDPQRAQATLQTLRERGYGLSIDDFGTGYSSLAYLKRLPVGELKIDRSFVMAMERDAGDAKIVRSTIDLAHNLGLTVVAEGVENAAIYDALKALGCDEAQGYHLGRPMPVPDFTRWALRWAAESPARAPALAPVTASLH